MIALFLAALLLAGCEMLPELTTADIGNALATASGVCQSSADELECSAAHNP